MFVGGAIAAALVPAAGGGVAVAVDRGGVEDDVAVAVAGRLVAVAAAVAVAAG